MKMLDQIFNFFKLSNKKVVNLSVEEIEVLALPRSPLWKKLRDEHLKKFPTCAVCGNTQKVVPHHIVPFHVDPKLELDPHNLISLCEGDTFNCHLFFGHFRKWTKYNPTVVQDSYEWNRRIKFNNI